MSLTATNPLHTDTRTEPGYIVVYDEVDASFTANGTGGPAPLHVKFTDTSTGDPTSWLWDFGDGGTSDKENPVHTYMNPGTYDVTLTASNGYSTDIGDRLRFVITVYGDLTAQFTENQTAGPNPLTVQFNDTTTGNPTTWAWDFGDGGTSTEKNPIHTFSSVGTYNVVLTVSHPDGTLTSGRYRSRSTPPSRRSSPSTGPRGQPRSGSSSRIPRPGAWTAGAGSSAMGWSRPRRTRSIPTSHLGTTPRT